MPERRLTYRNVVSYLKGLMTNRERHELERDSMRDPFEEDALEGLSSLSPRELQSDMSLLEKRVDSASSVNTKFRFSLLKAAALFVLVSGAGIAFYLVIKNLPAGNGERTIARIEEKGGKEENTTSAGQPLTEAMPQITGKIPAAPPVTKESGVNAEKVQQSPAADADENYRAASPVTETEEVFMEEDIRKEMTETPENGPKAEEDRAERNAPIAAGFEKMATESESIPAVSPAETAKAPSYVPAKKMYSAQVLDNRGEPMQGVNVVEKGTAHGVITDRQGRFSIAVGDSASAIALSFVGFSDIEIGPDAGDTIVMNEEVLALDEIVITGYSKVYAGNRSGRVAGNDLTAMPVIMVSGPVPPEGSLKAFKKQIQGMISDLYFAEYDENFRVTARISIDDNGSVEGVTIVNAEDIPVAISNELTRQISGSSSWKPATYDGFPVESDVILRFSFKGK